MPAAWPFCHQFCPFPFSWHRGQSGLKTIEVFHLATCQRHLGAQGIASHLLIQVTGRGEAEGGRGRHVTLVCVCVCVFKVPQMMLTCSTDMTQYGSTEARSSLAQESFLDPVSLGFPNLSCQEPLLGLPTLETPSFGSHGAATPPGPAQSPLPPPPPPFWLLPPPPTGMLGSHVTSS